MSGGGYKGLYTAEFLAGLEEQSGDVPLHRRFDLIAGTSIGGILALAVASGRTSMRTVSDAMRDRGAEIFGSKAKPSSRLGSLVDITRHLRKARYRTAPLRQLVDELVGEEVYVGDLRQRTIVPAVNLTKGSPQVFKTPHHDTFMRDWKLPVVDVALATSAAPTFFPLHTIGRERFADGGLYANSPDLLAVHEATHFLDKELAEIEVLSVGTTTSRFSFSGRLNSDMGIGDWMTDQRLFSAMIAAQQMDADFQMRHRLGNRYVRIDSFPSPSQLPDMQLDNASESAKEVLLGLAHASIQDYLPQLRSSGLFDHDAGEIDFFHRQEIADYFSRVRSDDGRSRQAIS